MNRYTRMLVTLTLGASACALNAQGPGGPRPPHGPPPLIAALDVNRDRVIGAEEISNASLALLKLDADGDGALSKAELRPKRHARPPRGDGADAPPPPPEGAQPPPPPSEDAPPPPPKGERHGFIDPIQKALDANGDGTLDTAEIANAPKVLLALDKNGDGQLTREEIAPPPPKGE